MSKFKLLSYVLAIFLISTPSHSELSAPATLPSGIVSVGNQSRYLFVVDKTRRFLRVYDFKSKLPHLLLEVPSDIGKKLGDKQRANDFRTPTGIYFLQKKLSPPEIPFQLYGSRAFTTDYPNIFDRRDQKGGSGIWLHAVPDTTPLTRGSRGCVVVRNQIIQQLEQYVTLGETPLVIFDKVDDVPASDFESEQQKFFGFFQQWKSAWETQDVDSYMKFYDTSFRNNQMNYTQWFEHKKRLKSLYKYIKVTLSEPLIIRNRDQVVIRTLQEYESDQHRDFGVKTIHAKYSPDSGFKIIREDWQPSSKVVLRNQALDASENAVRSTASEKNN